MLRYKYNLDNVLLISSDKRIKKDIKDLNYNDCLNKIIKLKPKEYKFIDVLNSTNIKNGFIAQEVKEVLPDAVDTKKDFIPNIYDVCRVKNNLVELNKKIKDNIKINDKLKIYDLDGKDDIYTVLEINDIYFKIDKFIKDGKCLVYGKEVNDFLNINYDYLYTLNIGASIQLNKKIELLNEKIDILWDELISMKEKNKNIS
jgi:hypothetical protein